jgi:hypothetical protein
MVEYFVGCEDPKRAHELDATMMNAYSLRNRKEQFKVNRWMLDSGAFSQIGLGKEAPGKFVQTPEEYVRLAVRMQDWGDLACIVTQDYMCEPEVLIEQRKKGHSATIRKHQMWTVERFFQIREEAYMQGLKVPVMPVLQGDDPYDYIFHLELYEAYKMEIGEYFPYEWIGIGSTCKRNNNPEAVADILNVLDQHMGPLSDYKVHAFGLKQTALGFSDVRDMLYSADSMAPDYAHRVKCRELGIPRTRRSRMDNMLKFQERIKKQSVQTSLTLSNT